MSRDLTPAVATEITQPTIEPVVFVEMEFDSSTLRLWSGYGEFGWDGKTWLGAGDLGQVSPVKETQLTQAENMTFTLNGIPSENIAFAMAENYQGRPITMWLGFLTNSSTVVADPIQTFSGRMDVMEIKEGADTSSITISAESRLADLLKKREWRYTHEDQQIAYPGDMGFEFVNALQDKEILWGG